jgi:hypothetical protein
MSGDPDPIMEELRRGRRAHAAKFGHDLKAICEDFRKREREMPNPVVAPPTKRTIAALESASRNDSSTLK